MQYVATVVVKIAFISRPVNSGPLFELPPIIDRIFFSTQCTVQVKTIGSMTMTLFTCTPLDMQSISDDDRTKKLEASYECSGVVKVKVKDSTGQDSAVQDKTA